MARMATVCLALSLILSFQALAADADNVLKKEASSGEEKREFELTYQTSLKEVPAGTKKLELWLPVPQKTAHQDISDLKFDGLGEPAVAVEPKHGNKIAYWKLEGDALKAFTLAMTFRCKRKEIAAKDLNKARALTAEEKEALGSFLQADALVPVGEPVNDVVKAAVGDADTPVVVSRKAYDYVLGNMRYSKEGEGWGKGSTKWACESKYGNCTDFHALFMSIARSRGVPVKFEMGIPLPEDKTEGPIGGYHCWAKFYLGGIGWVPVDISEAWKEKEKYGEYYYGNLTPSRVQLTVGRDVDLAPKQAGPALNYFVYPYAEADGKPVAVEKAFSFKDTKKEKEKDQ